MSSEKLFFLLENKRNKQNWKGQEECVWYIKLPAEQHSTADCFSFWGEKKCICGRDCALGKLHIGALVCFIMCQLSGGGIQRSVASFVCFVYSQTACSWSSWLSVPFYTNNQDVFFCNSQWLSMSTTLWLMSSNAAPSRETITLLRLLI